jgi:hypothetical protein
LTRTTLFSALLAAALAWSLEGTAHAFERQWHFGLGAGAAAANGYRVGPALNAYAAYGLSDVFDLRAELLGSRQFVTPVAVQGETPSLFQRAEPSLFYGGKLALSYKVDVIQWIPYAALAAGYLGVTEPLAPYAKGQPSLGIIAGLDYAATRNLGFGGALHYDYVFHPGAAYAALLFRAEYRFGF